MQHACPWNTAALSLPSQSVVGKAEKLQIKVKQLVYEEWLNTLMLFRLKEETTEKRCKRTYEIGYRGEEGMGLAVYSFLQARTRRHQTKGAGGRVSTKEILLTI